VCGRCQHGFGRCHLVVNQVERIVIVHVRIFQSVKNYNTRRKKERKKEMKERNERNERNERKKKKRIRKKT